MRIPRKEESEKKRPDCEKSVWCEDAHPLSYGDLQTDLAPIMSSSRRSGGSSSSSSNRAEREREKVVQDRLQLLLTRMLKDEDNKYCVDCDAKGEEGDEEDGARDWATRTVFMLLQCGNCFLSEESCVR